MSTTYTGLLLRDYVRQLTGVLSGDTLSDAEINQYIDESYQALALSQNWSWAPGGTVTSLTDSTSPVFAPAYHPVLAYDVASKVLATLNDDTNRGAKYGEEAAYLVESMYRDYISYGGTAQFGYSGVDNTVQFFKGVRTLLNSWDDTISDEQLNGYMNEAWINFLAKSNWGYPAEGNNGNPITFGDIYGYLGDECSVLAYDIAAKLSVQLNKPESFTAAMVSRYTEKYDLLYKNKILGNSSRQSIAASTTTDLIRTVRSLTNAFNNDISDTVIQGFIDDAFMTLVYERDWKWLQLDILAVINGSYGQNGIFLQTPMGGGGDTAIRRVLEVYQVTPVEEISTEQQSLEPLYEAVNSNDYISNGKYKYTLRETDIVMRTDTLTPPVHTIDSVRPGTVLNIVPAPKEDIKIAARVLMEPESFNDYLQTGVSYADQEQFGPLAFPLYYSRPFGHLPQRFAKYLAYKAAISVVQFIRDGNTKMIPHYEQLAEGIHDAMLKYYVLSNNTEAFSLGENGLTRPKYVPYFRIG